MDETVIYIILGIVFFIFRAFMGSKKNKNAPQPKRKPTKPVQPSGKKQSVDDIFKDFLKEIEKKQPEKNVKKANTGTNQRIPETMKADIMKAEPLRAEKLKKPELDWQEVSRPGSLSKTSLIDRSKTRIKPVESVIADTEIGKDDGYHFDIEEIDWRDAIISKEVLDRKY